jgi:hypothetical protein
MQRVLARIQSTPTTSRKLSKHPRWMKAVETGNAAKIEELAARGELAEALDEGKWAESVLGFAIWSRQFEVARRLLELGVDANAACDWARDGSTEATPIARVIKKRMELKWLLVLLQHGADPNKSFKYDGRLYTPAEFARERGHGAPDMLRQALEQAAGGASTEVGRGPELDRQRTSSEVERRLSATLSTPSSGSETLYNERSKPNANEQDEHLLREQVSSALHKMSELASSALHHSGSRGSLHSKDMHKVSESALRPSTDVGHSTKTSASALSAASGASDVAASPFAPPPSGNVKDWSVDQVCQFFAAQGCNAALQAKIQQEQINGEALVLLEPVDLQDLGVPMGVRKRLSSRLLRMESSNSDPSRHSSASIPTLSHNTDRQSGGRHSSASIPTLPHNTDRQSGAPGLNYAAYATLTANVEEPPASYNNVQSVPALVSASVGSSVLPVQQQGVSSPQREFIRSSDLRFVCELGEGFYGRVMVSV